MQGVGRADVLLYFKCPTTKQMRCPVNAYVHLLKRNDHIGIFENARDLRERGVLKTNPVGNIHAVGEAQGLPGSLIKEGIVYIDISRGRG